MSFIIVFDIPKSQAVEKVRINRKLKRIGAQLLQDSFWRLDDLNALIEIASWIRKIGGKASILEEKFIF
jgi:CRISPR/Cas system-associated endoribonuclease Cas2